MRLNLLTCAGLLAVTALVGCKTAEPLPFGMQQANIGNEAASVTQNLGCEWMKLPDPMYPAKGNDVACVADTFASVILFVEPSKEFKDKGEVPQVEKIKLVWKDWHDSVNMTDSKRDASRFIAYIAQRFFPQEDAPKLVDMFFGTSDKSHDTQNLDVKYTYRKQPALNLHRMEITNTDLMHRLFIYEAQHAVPSSDSTSTTSNITSGE